MSIAIDDYTLPKNIDTTSAELLVLPWYSAQENKAQGKAVYPESTSTILKLLQEKSIGITLAEGQLPDVILEDRHSIEWFGPIIFFSATVLANNPEIVTITLNIISNYLSNILFGDKVSKGEPIAKLEIVIKNEKGTKKIKYDGPVSGLSGIKDTIKALEK